MSVLTCKRWDNFTGNDTGDQTGYKETFICTVDSSDQNGHASILNSNLSTIPQIGDSHPSDPRATVKTRSVKPTKNRQTFLLEVGYEFKIEAGEDQGGGGGGTGLQVLDIQGGVWYEDIIFDQDQNGKRVQNSANDPIEIMTSVSHPRFTVVTRSQEFLVPDYIYSVNHVNNGVYRILGLQFKPNTLLFDEFDFKSLDNGWWEYTFKFKAKLSPRKTSYNENHDDANNRDLGWNIQVLDAGYREIDEKTGQRIPIQPRDQNKKPTSPPVTQPWPLDGGGKALDQEAMDEAKWEWREFQEKPRVGFWIFNWDWTTLLSKEAIKLGF